MDVKLNTYFKAKLNLASLFLCLLFLSACGDDGIAKYHKIEGQIFGTNYHITYQDPSTGVNKSILESDIAQRLKGLDWVFSTYKDKSELSLFNQAKVGQAVTVSDDFIQVFDLATEIYSASDKAFDPSIGPLVNLWGFGPKLSLENFQQKPEDSALEAAKAQLNFAKILRNEIPVDQPQDASVQSLEAKMAYSLTKQAPVVLDFSAIAKGYAVDAIVDLLDQHFVQNMMVEIGGELATRGVNARGKPWTIGVEAPQKMQGQAFSVLRLQHAHVATSGDYRNYFEIEGKRYSHTIDPRTAMPIDHKLASVTVIADSVAAADAWATAIMVLGEEAGFQLAQNQQLAVLLIYRDKSDGFQSKMTKTMESYLQ